MSRSMVGFWLFLVSVFFLFYLMDIEAVFLIWVGLDERLSDLFLFIVFKYVIIYSRDHFLRSSLSTIWLGTGHGFERVSPKFLLVPLKLWLHNNKLTSKVLSVWSLISPFRPIQCTGGTSRKWRCSSALLDLFLSKVRTSDAIFLFLDSSKPII